MNQGENNEVRFYQSKEATRSAPLLISISQMVLMKRDNKSTIWDDITQPVGLMMFGLIESTCLSEYDNKSISRVTKCYR